MRRNIVRVLNEQKREGGEQQNEARGDEKRFIIHRDPYYLSAVTQGSERRLDAVL